MSASYLPVQGASLLANFPPRSLSLQVKKEAPSFVDLHSIQKAPIDYFNGGGCYATQPITMIALAWNFQGLGALGQFRSSGSISSNINPHWSSLVRPNAVRKDFSRLERNLI
ncbi:UNVERIFIED_CONTAM: hypothetical protein Slati_2993000 [Sesamum latifolium]|uniref:Uncharacterized protein n=1 Tax=Sesamum latifolium TaxID=2727402 RepID=A0AAW2VG56_9LAMI